MDSNFDRILNEAIKLPEKEKQELANLLLSGRDQLSPAWAEEIDRRVAMEDSGQIEFRPIEELNQFIDDKYGFKDEG